MGLQSSDLILVERSNVLYKETYGNRANIDSSDLLLVDRGGTLYKCAYSDWPNANNTDLILVERGFGAGAAMYKETKANWPTTSNVDIHSANYMVTLGTLLYDQGDDSTNNYSVVEVQAEFSSSATVGDGYLYIGFRNSAGEGGTAGYPYYGDLPIAGIQILRANGTTIVNPQPGVEYGYCWNFAISSNREEWITTRDNITSKTATPASDPVTGNPVYYTIGTTATAKRFSSTITGTGSSEVGAARGIPSATYTGDDDTTTILAVGTANISQSSSSSDGYIFTECSGMPTGNLTWLKYDGNAMDVLQNGDRIRICYYGGGNGPDAAKGLQTTDSLYVRYIED